MNITFFNPGFAHSIDSILLFQADGETPYWSDSLFYFYPQLSKEAFGALKPDERRTYLTDALSRTYKELKEQLNAKAEAYNAHWLRHRAQAEDALSDAFELDARPLFNDLKGMITLNPVCPRFLKERTFDVFHMNSERGALGITLHEMIHYLWFHVWNSIYHDSYDEYERPGMKWILSEMVVESIMRDERLSSINPYFPRENGGCVYGYFQDMTVDGSPILDTIEQMYRRRDIKAFMAQSYAYCLRHEPEIRAHIEKAEQAF